MLAKQCDLNKIYGKKSFSEGNSDCSRPIGGKCVGNCRKIDDSKTIIESNSDCSRPIGGKCIGNCRKIDD